jgi:integrase
VAARAVAASRRPEGTGGGEAARGLGLSIAAGLLPAGAELRRGYFDRAAKEAGVAGLVPHELRHTAASLAIASGASVKAVQRMLGHASATLTLDRYGHLFPDEMDALAASLDNAMRGSGVVPMWSQAESSVSREEESEPKTGSDLRK